MRSGYLPLAVNTDMRPGYAVVHVVHIVREIVFGYVGYGAAQKRRAAKLRLERRARAGFRRSPVLVDGIGPIWEKVFC
jgi:hypothetical protein